MMSRVRLAGLVGGAAAVLALLIVSTACRRDSAVSAQQQVPQKQIAPQAVSVPVDGMICQVCAGTVKSTLKKIDGVTDAEISLEKRQAVIHYDERKVSLNQLTRAIKDAGYKPGVPTTGVQ